MKGSIIDKLEIIREIGRGGFGVVYLAQGDDGQYFALKSVFVDSPKYFNKELKALELYKKFSQNNKTDNLVKIIDIKISDSKIEYLMPLADGIDGTDVADDNWKPMTLTELVSMRHAKEEVFSFEEVVDIFEPIARVVAKLNENGIIHRDIKPDNIIFIKGKAHLADIGLIREDTYTASSAGTPDFAAPSWYFNTGGKVDMWGVATTLYFFLTGNSPDTIGRVNYMYPKFKDKMTAENIKTWQHFHKVILRATREKANERFLTFNDMIFSLCHMGNKSNNIDFSDAEFAVKRTSIFWINGRLGRGQFSIYLFFIFVVIMFAGMTLGLDNDNVFFASFFISYALHFPLMTLCMKRLHDANCSALWFFVIFPVVILMRNFVYDFLLSEENFIIFAGMIEVVFLLAMYLIFLAFKSDKHTNRFGVPNQKLSFF